MNSICVYCIYCILCITVMYLLCGGCITCLCVLGGCLGGGGVCFTRVSLVHVQMTINTYIPDSVDKCKIEIKHIC